MYGVSGGVSPTRRLGVRLCDVCRLPACEYIVQDAHWVSWPEDAPVVAYAAYNSHGMYDKVGHNTEQEVRVCTRGDGTASAMRPVSMECVCVPGVFDWQCPVTVRYSRR
jgi:hypothetical protein